MIDIDSIFSRLFLLQLGNILLLFFAEHSTDPASTDSTHTEGFTHSLQSTLSL